ncbi:MAG: ankyrin repeat domain-containing protein [Candidatus Sericytochromatia bacterium]
MNKSVTVLLSLSLLAGLSLPVTALPDSAASEQLLETGTGWAQLQQAGGELSYDLGGYNYQLTPLMLAALTGQPPAVLQALLSAGAPVDGLSSEKLTALQMVLSLRPELPTVQVLVAAGADLSRKNAWGANALQQAAVAAPADVLAYLLKQPRGPQLLAEPGTNKNTVLHLGALNPDPDSLALLLGPADKAQLASENAWQMTPLFTAIKAGNAQNVRLLLQAGSDPLHLSGKRSTLHIAAWSHAPAAPAVMEALLAGSASTLLHTPDASGNLPLHNAAQLGNPRVLGLLLRAGADQDVLKANSGGNTSLHYAAVLHGKEVLEPLLQAVSGQDFKLRDKWGSSPLHEAAGMGNLEALQLLLQADTPIDVNQPTPAGVTILMKAAGAYNNTEMLELLLKLGADPMPVTETGESALDMALFVQNYGNAQVLARAMGKELFSGQEILQLQQQAEAGQAEALYLLAQLYEAGASVPADKLKAINLYLQAAEHGKPEAWMDVGNLFENGNGMPQDYFKAREAYQHFDQIFGPKNNLAGSEAIRRLSRSKPAYFDSPAHALAWYRTRAQEGSGLAMLYLGQLCEQGLGTASDLNQAIAWYRRAARHLQPEADYRLGRIYQKQGNPATAAAAFRAAARQQYAEAQYQLGLMYHQGQGVTRDARLARFWQQQAFDQGLTPGAP